MRKILIPDQSVFLYFSPLDQLDLPQLLDCTEVEVLFTLALMEELIRLQWDHPVPKLQRRAKETIRRVEKWLENQRIIGPGIHARFIGRRPDSETMSKNHLNWQRQEDILLGTILECQQAQLAETVILLTGDQSLVSRSRPLGINAVLLSDDHLLSQTENIASMENRKLRQELTGFLYRTSSLSLHVAGSKDKVTIAIAPQLESLTETMQAQLVAVAENMQRETTRYQAETVLDELADQVMQLFPVSGHSFLERGAVDEVDRYLREVKDYPEKFEHYLRRCLEIINQHRRTIRLDLEMRNEGGAAAEEVLLVLTLPEQLEWYWWPGQSHMPPPPAPPTPPEPGPPALEKGFHVGGVSSVSSQILNQDYISNDQRAGALPEISEAGHQLKWELGTYRHHQARLLGPLYVRFRHADDISDFAIAWEIQDKNSADSVNGQLLLFVEQ